MIPIRESTQGTLYAYILRERVWFWDGEEEEAHCWHLIVRREIDSPEEIKYSLSNASEETSIERLAFMQGQRFWVERALQDVDFLDPNNPRQLMRRLRRLFNRSRLDKMEVNILRGILSAAQDMARAAGAGRP